MLTQRQSTPTLPGWLLAVPTLIILLLALPDLSNEQVALWVLFAVLTGFALNFGLTFSEGEINAAYTVGIMALLTMADRGEMGGALWAVAIGALGGVLIREARRLRSKGESDRKALLQKTWEPALRTAAQLTLGLAVAGWAYQQFNGDLPLETFSTTEALPILGLVAVYLAVYLSTVVLNMRQNKFPVNQLDEVVRLNWQSLLSVLFVPLPQAILGAVAYHGVSLFAFSLMILGFALLVVGVQGLSQIQHRYEGQLQEIMTITAVSNAMRSNLELQTLMQTIYLQVATLLDIKNFSVVIYDPGTRQLSFPLNMRDGKPEGRPSRDAGKGLIERVITSRNPLLIQQEAWTAAEKMDGGFIEFPAYSWLGVPLPAQTRVSGAIVVWSEGPQRQFTANDERLLMTVALQAGFAIENAQLYEQASGRIRQLRALTRVSAQLSSTLDAQQVLDRIGPYTQQVVGASASAIFMWWDEEKETLALVRSNGLKHDPPYPLLANETNLSNRQQPLIITDSHNDTRVADMRTVLDQDGKRSWVEVLMRSPEDILGVLVAYYDTPHPQSDEDIEVLRTFANQAALAISNAQLYSSKDAALSRRVDQLTLLEELSHDLFSTQLERDEIFQRVLKRAAEGTGAHAAILTLKDDGKEPERVAALGYTPELLQKAEMVSRISKHVLDTGDATLVPDVKADPTFATPRSETRSLLCVPLLRDIHTIGTIALESNSSNDFGLEDMLFLMQVGAQARIAIDSRLLFQNIQATRDRLQAILDSMTEAVLLIDSDGMLRLANPRARTLLDLDPDKLTGRQIRDILSESSMQFAEKLGLQTNMLRGLTLGLMAGTWKPEHELTQYDRQILGQHRFFERADVAIEGEGGRALGWLMVIKDMTEEREVAQAREDLTSMIVHDLRSPLTAINATLKLINNIATNDDALSREVLKQTTTTASQAVRKLLNLVNSLLDVSKMESGTISLERETGSLHRLAETVITDLKPLAEEMEVALENRVDAALPPLNVDMDKIERVILNLMDNAIKFTPSDGQVYINALLDEEAKSNGASEKFVQVRVVDSGPGIPDDYKEALFDRFVQIKEQAGRRRGTGLGLTFCKLAVEAHGGRIWIEDNPEGGAVFVFTLPVTNNIVAEAPVMQ
jgi:NtrC-family two-component system sensor histidine kinase KinB